MKEYPFDANKLKNYLVTGIAILLPVALTIIIVMFLFNLLTNPFVGMMTAIVSRLGFLKGGLWFISEEMLILAVSKILILIFLGVITVALGFFARWFFIHWILKMGESVVKRIPLISSVYKTSQDVIQTIFTSQTKSFKQAVLVPYPNKYTWSLGLVTRDEIPGLKGDKMKDPVAVFIPTTPNPTSGFLLLFERDDVIYVDMTIEDALKYVISCGVIIAPLNPLSKEEAAEKIARFTKKDA
jgi:uncharacterized membrane protein